MRSTIVLVCTLVLGIFLAAAAHAAPLRIGILPVLDTLPLQVGVAEGLFAEAGVEVELVPFSSALERDTAMQAGTLDGYFGDLLNTLMLIQAGVPMRVATISYATRPGQRMFGLVLAPGASRDDLGEAPTVGYSRATIIEYLLDRMAGAEPIRDISWERTEVKKIPIRMQMLLSGQLDAALLPEPLLTLAETKGGAVVATDEELDMPLTVICLREGVLDRADDFMDAYEEAVERINDDPEAYRGLMVQTTRVPKPLEASFPVYAFPEPYLPEQNDLWKVQQWMLTRGLLKSMLDYEQVVR